MAGRTWSDHARRLGIASGFAVTATGILYIAVIALWLVLEATPRAPIGDPYLAAMEILTILSALAIVGLVIAVRCFASGQRRVFALAALIFGTAGAGLTMAVHFVQLTAIRQLWFAGQIPDYRLIWPSPLFALEYFAWDLLIGLAMVCTGSALADARRVRPAAAAFTVGGLLCLAGMAGPISGWMPWQHVALLGYGIVLPVAGYLAARLFGATPRPTGSVAQTRTGEDQ